jgi:hypothetical protein
LILSLIQCQSLRTIKFKGYQYSNKFHEGFVEKMIQKIKENPNQRLYHLSLIIFEEMKINSVIRLIKVKKESGNEVNQKLGL